MLTTSTQPLALAARILMPATLEAVRRSPSVHLLGWKILDRWAVNSPLKLKALEQQGEMMLVGRLLQQQEIEHQVLTAALGQQWRGMAEHEILAAHEIATEL
jgi:hypothetical protein